MTDDVPDEFDDDEDCDDECEVCGEITEHVDFGLCMKCFRELEEDSEII